MVVGSDEATKPQREQLEPVARVVVEPEQGRIGTALRVQAFPVFAVLDSSGKVLVSGFQLDQVRMATAGV